MMKRSAWSIRIFNNQQEALGARRGIGPVERRRNVLSIGRILFGILWPSANAGLLILNVIAGVSRTDGVTSVYTVAVCAASRFGRGCTSSGAALTPPAAAH